MKIGNFYVNFIHNVKGRATSCKVYKELELKSTGHANLCSNDQYNKAAGRLLTLKRALYTRDSKTGNFVSNGLFTKEERTTIWNGLFAVTNISSAHKAQKRMVSAISKDLIGSHIHTKTIPMAVVRPVDDSEILILKEN